MKGATRSRLLQVGRRTRAVCVGLTWVLMALCALPLLVIILISLSKDGTWTTQLFPPVYTPENFIRLFDDPHVLEPIRNSFLMASVTTIAALGMGVTASYLLTKTGFRRFRVAGDLLLTLPYAIPGTVVALALILAFSRPVLASAYSILVGTFWILPLAYFIRMYPLVIRSTTAALSQFDDSLLEAAETFGAGPFKRFKSIIAPLILPSVVSGGLLVFITALGEFVSSILLYTYSNRPISVEILAQLRMFNLGGAAAYSVVLMILIMAATWIAGRLSGPLSEGSLPLQS
jgi:iron(III) transport system permease protein